MEPQAPTPSRSNSSRGLRRPQANRKYLPDTLIPEQLAVVVVFTLLSWALQLGAAPFKVALVGTVDTSLPFFAPPPMELRLMRQLVRPSLILAVVSYMITISIGNTFALKHGK